MILRSLLKGSSLLLLAALTSVEAMAQEAPDYNQDQYDAYNKAVNEPDLSVREKAILDFAEANPGLSLVKYAVANYVQLMQEYQKQGKPARVFGAGQKLLEIRPDNTNAQYMTAVSAFQVQKFSDAAKYGEQVYPTNSTAGLAYVLALTYQKLNNQSKFIHYGEKACAELEPKDCFQISSGLRGAFAAKEQWSRAAKYSRSTIDGLDAIQKPSGSSEREWRDYVSREKGLSYAVLGRAAVEKENWSGAVSNYQTAIKMYREPKLRAEAYYYIGLGRWKQNRLEPAMEAFAKGSLQRNAPHADPCRKYLETLYRSTHNGSTAGLDEFLRRVGRK
ncbi:MAG: tetratricopeptide repeat protein [Acidobacteriota bacterium]